MTRREYARAELHLSSDGQLVAAIGGAAAHFVQHAGLDDAESEALAAILEEFCLQTLLALEGESGTLAVFIEDFEDRIEITIENPGSRQPAVGAEPRRAAVSRQMSTRIAGVEMVRSWDSNESVYDEGRKVFRTRMVKYLNRGA